MPFDNEKQLFEISIKSKIQKAKKGQKGPQYYDSDSLLCWNIFHNRNINHVPQKKGWEKSCKSSGSS